MFTIHAFNGDVHVFLSSKTGYGTKYNCFKHGCMVPVSVHIRYLIGHAFFKSRIKYFF